jgi:SsrA-binding protein
MPISIVYNHSHLSRYLYIFSFYGKKCYLINSDKIIEIKAHSYIMTSKKSKSKTPGPKSIALNRKARHEYALEQRFEAGIVLQGWEVKSLREGKAQIADSYVLLKKGEAWLIGAVFSPLLSASSHIKPEPDRTRKLLLHKRELDTLLGSTERKGYALIPISLYWKKNHIKLEIALAKGKKSYDKRQSSKEQDWKREKARIFKKSV